MVCLEPSDVQNGFMHEVKEERETIFLFLFFLISEEAAFENLSTSERRWDEDYIYIAMGMKIHSD